MAAAAAAASDGKGGSGGLEKWRLALWWLLLYVVQSVRFVFWGHCASINLGAPDQQRQGGVGQRRYHHHANGAGRQARFLKRPVTIVLLMIVDLGGMCQCFCAYLGGAR